MPGHRIFATPLASVHPHYVAKVERKGRLNARALVTSSTGSAAPVPLILLADPLAPRLLDAGTSQRPGGRDGRGLTIKVVCPKPAPLAKNATKAVRRAAQSAAKAACNGWVEVRVDGHHGQWLRVLAPGEQAYA